MMTQFTPHPQTCKYAFYEKAGSRKNSPVVSRITDAIALNEGKKPIHKGEGECKNKKSEKNRSESKDIQSSDNLTNSLPEVIPVSLSRDMKGTGSKKMSFVDKVSRGSCSPRPPTSALIRTTKKSVRFNENCYVKKTISRKGYNSEEIEKCWYCAEEYREIHEECLETIRTIECGEEPFAAENCLRGLDCQTQTAITRRQRTRLDAIWVVLDEQYTGSSPEIIAEEYSMISYSSQLLANSVARRDQREAEVCY